MEKTATKPGKAAVQSDAPEKPNQLTVELKQGESPDAATARYVLDPVVRGGIAAERYRPAGLEPIPLGRMISELAEQCAKIESGVLTRPETMLTAQAQTLDAVFNRLAAHAADFIGHNAETMDRYLRLALKAQGQCRTTLETLVNLKNPPIIYARQANFANGHQQVNNHPPGTGEEVSPVQTIKLRPNKLLEAPRGKRMDRRAKGKAGGGN